MTTEDEPEVGPVVKVGRHLTAILAMHEDLLTEAVHNATDPLMPGGEAMAALGYVANLEAWGNLLDASERLGRAYTSAEDEDPDDAWSAFQLLEFWSEAWRRERGEEYDMRPTIVSEASYLRHTIAWAWDHEVGFDDFAEDVRKARTRLENIMHDGNRSERGVPCLSCGEDLVRPTRARKVCHGHDGNTCGCDRGGRADWWTCPGCERRYDIESYFRAVAHAHYAHAGWLTLDACAERTSVKAATIKVWATRGKVAKRKDVESGRVVYSVEDVLEAAEVIAS